MTESWAIALALAAALLGGIAPIFLKRATKTFAATPRAILTNKHLLGGVCLNFIAVLLFTLSLKGGDVSVLYPFEATAYFWAAIASRCMLKEHLGARKLIGIGLIILGVILVGTVA